MYQVMYPDDGPHSEVKFHTMMQIPSRTLAPQTGATKLDLENSQATCVVAQLGEAVLQPWLGAFKSDLPNDLVAMTPFMNWD